MYLDKEILKKKILKEIKFNKYEQKPYVNLNSKSSVHKPHTLTTEL